MRTVFARPYGSRKGRVPDGSWNSSGGGIGGGGGGGMCELLLSDDALRLRSLSVNMGDVTRPLKLDLRGDFDAFESDDGDCVGLVEVSC